MDWIEADPIPEACFNCEDGDCYECDTAGDRWFLSVQDELKLKKKSLEKAIARIERQLKEIEEQLISFSDDQLAAMAHKIPMTEELFFSCYDVLMTHGNLEMVDYLLEQFPEYNQDPEKPVDQAWKEFKEMMRADYGPESI